LRLAREADLLAAHHAEYVPDRHPNTAATFAALQAAVSYGCAIGLRHAAQVIATVESQHASPPERR